VVRSRKKHLKKKKENIKRHDRGIREETMQAIAKG